MEQRTSKSEMAQFLAQIETGHLAARNGLIGFAEIAKNQAISACLENMGKLHQCLHAPVGDGALQSIVECLDQRRVEESNSRMYCVHCSTPLDASNQEGIICRGCRQARRDKRINRAQPLTIRYCYGCGQPYHPDDDSIHHKNCLSGFQQVSISS